jgi:8-amino-7-oxononanoate synthase
VSDFLITAGFYVKPVLSPTVKKGKERVRICIHTFNTDNQIINLANAIKLQIAQARN